MKEKRLREFFCRKRGVKRLNRNYQKELEKLIEQIKKEVALSKTQLDMMEAAIDKLNIALNSHNIEIKKELTDFINQVFF